MKEDNGTGQYIDSRRRVNKTLPARSSVPDDISLGESPRVPPDLETRQIGRATRNEELHTTRLELERSYHKYKNLYDFAPVGYLTVSESGLILETNLTAVMMLGVGKVDLLQQPLSHFVFRDDQDIFSHYREQLLESQFQRVCELRMVKPGSSHLFVRLEGIGVRDNVGQICEFRLTVSDITARHDAEKAIHESEERHRIISELTSDYIYSAVVYPDRTAETNWLSGSVERVTGYTLEEIRTLEGGWNAILHPDELHSSRSAWESLLANETIVHEYRILTKAGQIRWLRDYKKPVWDEAKGRVTLIWGAVQDITERKCREEALTRYSVELEERNEELDAFAHTVAHDLKNPLHIILGYAQLLAENQRPSLEAIQPPIAFIAQAADKMNHIIDGLLLFASVGKEEVEIRPLDMSSIMTGVWHVLGQMIEEYQAVIVVPDTWPVVMGYGPWIETVWTNYLSNAMKFGGKPPKIELGATTIEREEVVRFWIRDNGPGLTSDDRSRLFVPFTRLAPAVAEGNGVGLSIVQRIIERLGGQIDIESEVGRGSTFGFRLPRVMD